MPCQPPKWIYHWPKVINPGVKLNIEWLWKLVTTNQSHEFVVQIGQPMVGAICGSNLWFNLWYNTPTNILHKSYKNPTNGALPFQGLSKEITRCNTDPCNNPAKHQKNPTKILLLGQPTNMILQNTYTNPQTPYKNPVGIL